MNSETVATVLPTALSASVYVAAHTTFFVSMFRRPVAPKSGSWPRVSVLKPVAGLDDGLRENLESFAALDYASFELLIGFASADDPAVPLVRAFFAAHPELDGRIVWTTPASGCIVNPKVAQLIDLNVAAAGQVIVVSDANVRVPPSYLRSLVGHLMKPGVGLVSSLVAGGGWRSLGAALENAQLNALVAPGIVAAGCVIGRVISVGKSMAMRKADLARVGGWESVADVLAEDDVIGQRFHAHGLRVEVCLDPIENYVEHVSVMRSIERHARWAKMRRALEPVAFTIEPLLSPLVMATLILMFTTSAIAMKTWAYALGLHCTGALMCMTLLGARRPLVLAALEPFRVAAMLLCWSIACVSRKVVWRGNVFSIGEGSKLTAVHGGDRAAALER